MTTEIRLQMGEKPGKAFVEFWNFKMKSGEMPQEIANLEAKFVPSPHPTGGVGMSIPPEVIMAFAAGIATGVGTGIGTLVWEKLREYFEKHHSDRIPRVVIMIINNQVFQFDPLDMSKTLPDSFTENQSNE